MNSTRLRSLSQRLPTLAEIRAERASRSLIAFTEYTYERYQTAAHHRIVAEQLERVERREIDRLMLLLPPRHGKTELASRRYPAWNLGRNPSRQIIAASATSDFATDVGREVRDIVRGEEYRSIFPGVALSADSAAAGRWHTNHGGVFAAVGVGSQILGKGADDFIIDDPFATMEEAQSETQRKRVIAWYQGSVYNRLQPGGAIVLINHRMHEDDLSGYLLSKQNDHDGDRWEVVELPAINQDDEALWPESYPLPALRRIQANTLPKFWSSLYQQNPTPDEGTYFQRDWFKRYGSDPETGRPHLPLLHKYGTSDYATKDGSGDYTVHHVWGVSSTGDLYLVDRWRGQTTSDVWIERHCDLVALHKPLAWFGEAGPIYRAIEPAMQRRMRERNAMVRMEPLPSISDKPTSARGFQSRAATGRVYLPDTPEGDAVLDELLRFPAGKYDDEVDACSKIGRALDEMHPAIVRAKPADQHTPKDRYRPRRQDISGSAWG